MTCVYQHHYGGCRKVGLRNEFISAELENITHSKLRRSDARIIYEHNSKELIMSTLYRLHGTVGTVDLNEQIKGTRTLQHRISESYR